LVTSSMDKRRTFRKQTNGTWAPDTGQRDSLTELKDANGVRTGWQHKRFEDDAIENYSATGVLQSIKERNGWTTTLTYSDAATPVANYLKGSTSVPTPAAMPGLLISVKNHFGRELKFTYEAVSISGAVQARLKELLPPGAVSGSGAGLAQSPIVYGYEEAASLASGVALKGQLTSVTWQDGTLKRYHYENTSLPNHLTGITDEAGVRVGTYAYNGSGQAISSEKAGGAEKLTFHYSGDGRTHVTDYTGPNNSATTRTYSIQVKNGVARPTAVTAPCPTCGSTQQSTLYGDGTTANGGAGANGQPIKTVAHDGTVTFYTYDAKGRETEKATFPASYAGSSTRPALNLASSVISTQWHAAYNLPTKRAEPGKITAYTYANANATTGMGAGNLTGQSETITTDATGASKFTAVQAANTPIKSTGWSYSSTSSLPTTIVERETAFGATGAVEKNRNTFSYDSVNGNTTKVVIDGRTYAVSAHDAAGKPTSVKAGSTELIEYLLPWYGQQTAVSPSALSKQTTFNTVTKSSSKPVKRPDGNPWGWGCGDESSDHIVPDGWSTVDFLAACRSHDNCYGACKSGKAKCDWAFYGDLNTACLNGIPISPNDPTTGQRQLSCIHVSTLYYLAVTLFGGDAYKKAQEEACKGCKK
jgi:YD repeat-containing protein